MSYDTESYVRLHFIIFCLVSITYFYTFDLLFDFVMCDSLFLSWQCKIIIKHCIIFHDKTFLTAYHPLNLINMLSTAKLAKKSFGTDGEEYHKNNCAKGVGHIANTKKKNYFIILSLVFLGNNLK